MFFYLVGVMASIMAVFFGAYVVYELILEAIERRRIYNDLP
jgi:hypothetical protein